MPSVFPLTGDKAPDVDVDPFDETGVTGLDRTGLGFGYVDEEWLRDLRGQTPSNRQIQGNFGQLRRRVKCAFFDGFPHTRIEMGS